MDRRNTRTSNGLQVSQLPRMATGDHGPNLRFANARHGMDKHTRDPCFRFCFYHHVQKLGVVLHSNADELGIAVLFSQDITDSKIANAFDNELSALSDKLYQLSNAGEHNKAQQSYQQHLETNAYASEALMFDRFKKWEDSRFAIKVGRSYIDRLVCVGKNSEAWDVLLFCFRANQNKYRLLTPESVLSLSRGTLSLQQKTVIAHLLSHFSEDFPAHHTAANCLLQAAKHYALDLTDPVLAEQALTQFEQRFPDGTSNTTYLALKEIINRLPNR